MLVSAELREKVEGLIARGERLFSMLRLEALREKLHVLRERLRDERLWSGDCIADAQRLQKELKECERKAEPAEKGKKALEELKEEQRETKMKSKDVADLERR